MVSFRKAFLLVTALLAIVSIASAQPATCKVETSNVPVVRSEGIAEEVGQVVIRCSGGKSKDYGQVLDNLTIQIFLNVNVTSRRTVANDSSYLEAMLLIDEPNTNASGQGHTSTQRTCNTTDCINANSSTGGGGYAGGGGSPFGYNATGTPAGDGKGYNVIQGRLLTNNSIVWPSVPWDAPGTTAGRVLRIVNVRANASGLGLGSGILPNGIQMYLSIQGTNAPQLDTSQLVVAYAQKGLRFSSDNSGATYLQCEPSEEGKSGIVYKTFELRFRERFGTAFEWAPGYASPATVNEANLLTPYYTEHGYANPNLNGVTNLGSSAGRATSPTRLLATFTGLPTNVLLRVPRIVKSGSGTTEEVAEYIQCFDGTGASCTNVLLSSSGSTADITPVGGTAVVVYEITKSNNSASADFKIAVGLRYGPIKDGIAGPPGVGEVTVTASYAPTSSTLTSILGPAPRFIIDPADTLKFSFVPCRTNILFPYVTNLGGFDTGIVVANTSLDKFGTVAQNGTCMMEFYGKTGDAGAAPGAVTTEEIPAGMSLKSSLALGGNYGMPAAKEFEGYIIARCNFQYAHGFAFIYDATPPAIDNAMGYLALVLDGDKDSVTSGSITGLDTVAGTGTISLDRPKTRTGSISEVRGQ